MVACRGGLRHASSHHRSVSSFSYQRHMQSASVQYMLPNNLHAVNLRDYLSNLIGPLVEVVELNPYYYNICLIWKRNNLPATTRVHHDKISTSQRSRDSHDWILRRSTGYCYSFCWRIDISTDATVIRNGNGNSKQIYLVLGLHGSPYTVRLLPFSRQMSFAYHARESSSSPVSSLDIPA